LNRARQDATTTEIMDIVGAAEAPGDGSSDEAIKNNNEYTQITV